MKSKPQKANKKPVTASSKVAQVDKKSLRKYYYLLGLFTFFIFANTIGNGYNMDDGIVTNGHKLTSQGLSAVGEIFTSNYYSDAMGYAFGYRPIVHLSFALEHELFGEKPGAGHFINVILFALSVVLFFKLLIKWVGEKNLLFAGIAALLFAVHPIHTEVVASLKNRDELLAFLFVIWAGLSAHKYLEKGKWISLISIIILFSMAMLSKKSVYPIAVVVPASIILLKEISLKQLVFLGLSFIIPAAVIGSELELTRMGIMIILPVAVLSLIYLVKHVYLSNELLNEQLAKLRSAILPILFIVVITLIAIYFSSFVLLLFTIPIFFWLFKTNLEIGLMVIIFVLISIDAFWLDRYHIQILQLIIGIGYVAYIMFGKEKNSKWWILSIIATFYFLTKNHDLNDLALLLNLFIFTILLYRKSHWAFLFSVLTLVATLVFFDGDIIYSTIIVLISASVYVYKKTKNKNWTQYTAVIAFSITLCFIGYENFQSNDKKQSVQIAQQEKQKFVKNENVLKEGRQLEFVENTLVAPHTKEEEIGTGFATLGEYFRLMLFPYELSFYYGYAKTDTFNLKNGWAWLFIVIHLAMLFLAIFHIKKNPMITIGVFWYLLCIVLFSNWIELVAGMVGERLAFTASAGFCIFIIGILFWLKPDLNFKNPGVFGSAVIVIMVFFTGRTIIRNTDWKDTITLMGNDISHLKNSAQANNIYAMHLMAESTSNRSLTIPEVKEMQQKAIFHFDQATNISPDYFNVYIDKARAMMITGEYKEGIKSLKKAIEIDPENEYSYYILVDFYERMQDGKSYLEWAKKLFEISENERTYGTLARGYFLVKDFDESKKVLVEGLQKYPNSKTLAYNLRVVEEQIP